MYRGVIVCMFFLLAIYGCLQPPAPAPKTSPSPAANSLIIVNGKVVDGTGAKARKASVRIEGDTIAEIGDLTPKPGERVIEANDMIVAPGFIDTHSHADGGLLESPDAETQIRQGITTAIVGQDGGSNTPLSEWFAKVEQKRVALNLASFVGHGAARKQVIGEKEKRKATPEDLAKMAALIEQEMEAGALGLSSGLEYVPGRYADTEELIACAKAAAKHGGLYISHVRNEDDFAFDSFAELFRIAEEAKLPAQISHIKLGSASVWGKADDILKKMADAEKRGLDITADVYPYLYWQSTIRVLIPTEDFDDRKLWEKGLANVGGAKNVRLTAYSPEPTWQGKTLTELAALTGKDAVTLAQEIVSRTEGGKGRESVVVTAMAESDLRRFIASPRVMFCSDGGLKSAHPRGAGSYPRILGEYARKQKVIPLEEAVRKMTSYPARRMGLQNRGTLAVGMKADIVLFDPETVSDTATVANPTSPPIGIPTVIVNGVPVLENGRVTGAHPGSVLRKTDK